MSSFHLRTLGCPKNAVDSEKIAAALLADGLAPVSDAGDADLVVLNTCAFVEAAREESIAEALALAAVKRPGSRLVVTGCMAERYGDELSAALPEVDAVVGFGGEAHLQDTGIADPKRKPLGVRDLLDLPRRAPEHPWAYLKVAEGCDRACAFCAIPQFRGRQVSRAPEAVVAEASALVDGGVGELVLVAQDVASYGRDTGVRGSLAPLMERLDDLASAGLARQRLLYLYPSEVRGRLLDVMCELPTAVPYFDLSLQHASPTLLRRMRRWGSGDRFLALLEEVRGRRPEAAFRSSFIVGFPGETENDHDMLIEFLEGAELDWAGFFAFSPEDGTPAAGLEGAPPTDLVAERISELTALQDRITHSRRHALVGAEVEVMVDGPCEDRSAAGVLVGRTHREAPEIDGVVEIGGPGHEGWARPGALVRALVTGVAGPDLEARAVGVPGRAAVPA
ncbi:MAG: 30S ribosomal protein S12 methylthiotransferase RimO [Actinobacteria bacterium]|nr:30S ribosomal protein S12 methylthiotransferase RimO [Actinomycetota bacterium]